MPTACWENTSSLATGVRLCSQSAATPLPTLPPHHNPSFLASAYVEIYMKDINKQLSRTPTLNAAAIQ